MYKTFNLKMATEGVFSRIFQMIAKNELLS